MKIIARGDPHERFRGSGWQRAIVSAATAMACIVLGCHAKHVAPIGSARPDPRIANLHAFARLYGVLRWFHPSDAASAIDWEQFAVHGIRRVMSVNGDDGLRTVLKELIASFAPTVQIVESQEHFSPLPRLQGVLTASTKFVSWQHQGYGDSTLPGTFTSKRRHRPQTVAAPGVPYAILSQSVDAVQLRGARLRLRARVSTGSHGLGRIWLRVDRGEERGFFDNMNDRPITTNTWATAEIIGTADKDATRIVFGTVTSSGGTVWYDDFELATEGPDGAWRAIDIRDPGFESGDLGTAWSPGNGRAGGSTSGWNITLDHTKFVGGHASLRVSAETRTITDELFTEAPNDGEAFDLSLARGLRARVPISIYSRDQHTYGDDLVAAKQAASRFLETQPIDFDPAWGIADIVITWNVFQHFWPYWDTAQIDWEAKLDAELIKALSDRDIDDHILTLRQLIAGVPDGHAEVRCPGATPQIKPPFAVDVIEGQVVVVASVDTTLRPGDVVLHINGRSALSEVQAEELTQSGSPQWRRVRANERFGIGSAGSALVLEVRRGNSTFQVSISRDGREARPDSLKSIEELEGGIYYVDLRRTSLKEIEAIIEPLSRAPGVIFDLRGYPNNNHEALSYLISSPVDANKGMAAPRIIRPDHVRSWSPSWQTASLILNPRQPHISGRVAFLTDATARSYAETIMRLVEHYRLGAIVGAATAGTNGNMAEITTPTGCRVSFTGLRVTNIDGSRSHLIGVRPTIPISRTIAGVVSGRDEVLDAAIAYVRGIK